MRKESLAGTNVIITFRRWATIVNAELIYYSMKRCQVPQQAYVQIVIYMYHKLRLI